jgi:hypothetical protein|eukprot:COSAG02_NODE_5662_length_4145_cov_2.169056_6_plen_173_part_00
MPHRDIAYRRAVSISRFNTAHTVSICQPTTRSCKMLFLIKTGALRLSLEAISVNVSPASGSTPARLNSSNIAAWYAFTSIRNGRVLARLNLFTRIRNPKQSQHAPSRTVNDKLSSNRFIVQTKTSASFRSPSVTGRSWARSRLCIYRSPSARQFASHPSHPTTPHEHCHRML